jgi:hypothetical protein
MDMFFGTLWGEFMPLVRSTLRGTVVETGFSLIFCAEGLNSEESSLRIAQTVISSLNRISCKWQQVGFLAIPDFLDAYAKFRKPDRLLRFIDSLVIA